MLEELSKSIKANLYERATSPLFGTFVISWCLWNYKAVFVLLSSMPVTEKFDYLETYLYSNMWSCVSSLFLYPVVSAVLFIFIYPYPALFVYKYWHERQKKQKEAKQAIEDETPLTIEESRNIRREHFRLETEYDNEIERKETEIERLKNHITELDKKINSLTSPYKEKEKPKKKVAQKAQPSPSLNKDEIDILRLISDKGGIMRDSDVIHTSKFDKVKTEYYLENMENNGYLVRGYKSGYSDYMSELTTISKKLMVEKGFVK